MGEIIGCRSIGSKVIYRVKVDIFESLSLKGNLKNIQFIDLENCVIKSKIIEKGKDGVTKHFHIPGVYRKSIKGFCSSITYQVSDFEDKMIFVYILSKKII